MVSIFNRYTEKEEKLCSSYNNGKKNNTVVVLEDDGFLPEGIVSPFRYYVQEECGQCEKKEPLFANLLETPELWEIAMRYDKAEIFSDGIKKAEIEYALPEELHNVKSVKWMMEDGHCYRSDFYDKAGNLYFCDFYDEENDVDIRIYYADNKPVIICQPYFERYTLFIGGRITKNYNSKKEFIMDFVNKVFKDEEEIITNDANLAGWVAEADMVQKSLIVQGQLENISLLNSLPDETRIRVLFDSREELNKWRVTAGVSCERFYYSETTFPDNQCVKDILILTNSDEIEKLEEIIVMLPEFEFNIAAATLMSEKLMNMEKYSNVTLYPGISKEEAKDLFKASSFYLDINHYSQIFDAVYEAYRHNLLIVGFEETLHDKEYVLTECIFPAYNYENMVAFIKTMSDNEALLKATLIKQNQLPNFEDMHNT